MRARDSNVHLQDGVMYGPPPLSDGHVNAARNLAKESLRLEPNALPD